MINESITCDNCGKELIEDSQYPHTFVLELSVIDTNRNSTGSVFLVHTSPPFTGKKHFCNKKCLSVWVDDR